MPERALVQWRQRRTPTQIVDLAGFGIAIALLGDLTLYVVLPTHTAAAGIALSNVGLMLSANRLIRILVNGPFGMLIERVPRRRIAVPALFIGALSSLLYIIPGFWPLLLGRLMWGIAWSGMWLSASTMVLDISTDARRGRFVGRLQMWFFIGGGVSSFLGGALTDWLGYSEAFTVCAVLAMAGAVIWWLFLPETRNVTPQASNTPHIANPAPLQAASIAANSKPLLTAILLLGVNWLIFIGILGATLPLLLEERIGETILLIGLVIPLSTFTGALAASNQLVSLLASPFTGWLSDYSQQRWGLVIVALVLGIAATSLTAIGTGVFVIIATMISALTTSMLQTQVMTLVGDYARPNQRGRILGMLNTVGDLGSAGGPLLAYALLASINLSGLFWLAAGVLVLVLPWTVWIARQEARPVPRAVPVPETQP